MAARAVFSVFPADQSTVANTRGRGWQSAATALSTCVPCPAGQYSTSTSSIACTLCDEGTVSLVVGANTTSTCIPCAAGSYSTGSGANTLANCTKCSAGYYSTFVAASALSVCSACTAGSYSSASGASSPLACGPCDAGKYADLSGASKCYYCSPGFRVADYVPHATAQTIFSDGLYARYVSSNFSTDLTWPDLAGNPVRGAVGSGSDPPSRSCARGNGADALVCFVQGSVDSTLDFHSIPPISTVCSVTRYTGTDNQDKILQSGSGWLHGHSKGLVGVANYSSGWRTPQLSIVPSDLSTSWLIRCGENSAPNAFYANR